MDQATAEALVRPAGRAAVASAEALGPTLARYPALLERLSKLYPPALARAALDLALVRDKARQKFPAAAKLFLTREGAEMASGPAVAQYRARRYREFGHVADLCCGVGGDTMALAGLPGELTALDLDPAALTFARANVAPLKPGASFRVADALTDPLPGVEAAFADPSRRVGGARTLDFDAASPPLTALVARFPAGFPLGVKLAPGLPRDDLRRLAQMGAEAEFLSVGGELKECVAWFGPLAAAATRATVLDPAGGAASLTGVAGAPVPVGGLGAYLYDPDPAVSRADLTATLAEQLGAATLDFGLALLSGPGPLATPFATVYEVLGDAPARPKPLAEWLRAHGVGRVTLVKRGLALDTEALRPKLKLSGPGHCEVVLTRVAGAARAVFARRA